MLKTSLEALRDTLRRLTCAARGDVGGGIAPMAAGGLMMLTLMGFGAVEFSNYVAVRSNLQNALDAAALAVARSASVDATELQTIGEAVIRAQVPFDDDLTLNSFTVTILNGRITTYAQVGVGPIVSDIIFKNDLIVSGRSEVLREVWGLEVALVLDTTGSMETNNRIGIAKTAAENFINTLEAAARTSSNPTQVKYALVPFAATVNVGPEHSTATWMDQQAQSPIHSQIFTTALGMPSAQNRWTLLNRMQIPWGGCVESRPMPFDIQDTPPDVSTPATLFVPYFAPDETDQLTNPLAYNARFHAWPFVQPYWHPNSYIPDLDTAFRSYDPATRRLGGLWPGYTVPTKLPNPATGQDDWWNVYAGNPHGLIRHVNGQLLAFQGAADKYTRAAVDAEVTAGRFSRTSRDEGPNRNCKVTPIKRLTDDGAAVVTAIKAMQTGGSTNIPMGLMWGWHALSPHDPFNDGEAYRTPGNTKIIVLMTDGENSLPVLNDNVNRSEYSGVGYTWQNRIGAVNQEAWAQTAALNSRLAALCTNVKAEGVILYTVRLEMTGDNTMLQTCATDPTKAFDVRNAAALDSTFQAIARSIQNLRVAR